MYLSDEAMKIFNSKWVERKPGGELGYQLKKGAPKKIREEFNHVMKLLNTKIK